MQLLLDIWFGYIAPLIWLAALSGFLLLVIASFRWGRRLKR